MVSESAPPTSVKPIDMELPFDNVTWYDWKCLKYLLVASECSVLPTKVAGSTSCNMASTICCWATAFASISNLELTAILGSLSGKTLDNLYKTAYDRVHCVQTSTATVVWFHFRWAKKDVRTREVGTFCVPIWYILSFYWFCIYINMFPTFVTILPLTIPANYRLSSQFLWVGLKVGVRVWLMQEYLFATVW